MFPAPLLNPATPRTGGTLAQAGQISLDKPVRDIQGCDFVTATRLVCASDDGSGTLFPQSRPLLQVDLPHPLDGKPVTGRVSSLFGLPSRACARARSRPRASTTTRAPAPCAPR